MNSDNNALKPFKLNCLLFIIIAHCKKKGFLRLEMNFSALHFCVVLFLSKKRKILGKTNALNMRIMILRW